MQLSRNEGRLKLQLKLKRFAWLMVFLIDKFEYKADGRIQNKDFDELK